MIKFITTYMSSSKCYTSYVWAYDISQAEELVRQRNIGEYIQGVAMNDTPQEYPEKLSEQLHEAVFLSWIGLKSGILTIDQVLSDTGIIHSMAHGLVGATVNANINHGFNLEWLRHQIPGYLKPINI